MFIWLFTFSVLTRFSMTLFIMPHQSLVADLTKDYHIRTSLQSSRVVFGWVFGLLNAYLGYTYFLKPEGSESYDPTGFQELALFGALVILIAVIISTIGTYKITIKINKRR